MLATEEELKNDSQASTTLMRKAIVFLEEYEKKLDGKIRVGYETKIKLTKKTDFGKDWFDAPCSQRYWREVKSANTDVEFLTSFCSEVERIAANEKQVAQKQVAQKQVAQKQVVQKQVVQKLWRLLMGGEDCYRVILDEQFPCIYSYNMRGSLAWGRRLRLSTSKNFMRIYMDEEEGFANFCFDRWVLAGRLCNEVLKVEMIGKSSNLSSYYL